MQKNKQNKDHKTKSQKDSPQKNWGDISKNDFSTKDFKTWLIKQHHESSADISMRSNFTLGVFTMHLN